MDAAVATRVRSSFNASTNSPDLQPEITRDGANTTTRKSIVIVSTCSLVDREAGVAVYWHRDWGSRRTTNARRDPRAALEASYRMGGSDDEWLRALLAASMRTLLCAVTRLAPIACGGTVTRESSDNGQSSTPSSQAPQTLKS